MMLQSRYEYTFDGSHSVVSINKTIESLHRIVWMGCLRFSQCIEGDFLFVGEEILGPLRTIYQLCQDECEATRELIDKERGLGAFQMEVHSFDSRAL